MRRKQRTAITFTTILALAAAAYGAPTLQYPPDPLDPVAAAKPLATAAEEKSFHEDFDKIINDAQKGTPEDRKKASELLERRASSPETPRAVKQLLAIAAFDLARTSSLARAEIVARGRAALALLEGPSADLTVRRIALRKQLQKVAPQTTGFSDPDIAADYFSLAATNCCLRQYQPAGEALELCKQFAAKDSDFSADAKDPIEKFGNQIKRQLALDETLAASPNDPDANTERGLAILAISTKLPDAAPFLSKSAKPELRKLGEILATFKDDIASRLEVAAAADAATGVVEGESQRVLATLVQEQATHVALAKSGVTEDQKSRAQALLTQADNLLAKTKPPVPEVPIKFYGLLANGAKVVYILDHSGSMLDTFDFLRQDIIRSTEKLTEEQSFNVIMVSERASQVFPSLQKATAERKKDFTRRIARFRAQGMNDDLLEPWEEAFKLAFALKPDAIYFLTDGHHDPRLLEAITKLNADKKTSVNTVAFVNKDPTYEAQLQEIAKKNGGKYKFVSETDLGK